MPDVLPGDTFVLSSAIGNITFQASQILGFVAGAGVVAVLDPHKTLGIDAATFAVSAVILAAGVRSRPAPARAGGTRASLWSVSADGVRIVFGSRLLLTLLLFGCLAGFYIVPEGLAAPYARSLHGNALTVGLLMAAVPLGMVIGAFLISRIAAPSARIRMMGWLAVLSCAPLIGSAWSPPLWVALALWTLAGAGGAYQLAAAAAFVQALRPDTRARAFGVAQSGLYAVQGLGILAGGAVAQLIGAPLAVGLAGLAGLTAATMLAMSWTHLRGRLSQARPNGPESPWPRRLGAPLADEGLRDGAAVAALFGDHDPGDQVEQDAGPAEDREQGEPQPDQGRVDTEVGRYADTHARDHTSLVHPVQALAWIDVRLSHS